MLYEVITHRLVLTDDMIDRKTDPAALETGNHHLFDFRTLTSDVITSYSIHYTKLYDQTTHRINIGVPEMAS